MSDADNLEIKKRARRRLVGAAALALTAAIVLPMMMEQEPAPSSPDIQVTIPDRDSPSASGRPDSDARTPDAALPPAPVEEPPQPGVAEAPSRPAPGAAEAPRAASPASPRNAGDEEARVRALLDGKPPASAAAPATPAPAAKEGYVLQIGAFGDPAKAGSISSELKQAGFSAYTEKAGAMTRVRVGPFASRDEAEKVAARLKAQGRNVVLTPR